MARPTGSADLPLHGGRVPMWLAGRMARLGRVIVEAILVEYGRAELLRRLAHPFWFQSLGAVMGMDWHSSGITTSVLGALKRGLAPAAGELGVFVCGGRGRASRRTPGELLEVGDRTGLDGDLLARTSRLVAKVDSAAVQDGFALYLHGFVVTADGGWTVVQQGMSAEERIARRYHWLSEGLESFVEQPHAAVEGPERGLILNMTDRGAGTSRARQLELVGEPDRLIAALSRAREQTAAPQLHMPGHHAVAASDVSLRRLHGALRAAAEVGPREYADLLLVPGVGARTVEALALVAEVIHGAPCRFRDPARFACAHGGKDGSPFPVPLAVYDRTIGVIKDAVGRARLGQDDRMAALRELDRQARALEREDGPPLAALFEGERRRSAELGGRTVFSDRAPSLRAAPQLELPGLKLGGPAPRARASARTAARPPRGPGRARRPARAPRRRAP
ncbi:MAG TPA: DUF763 domain-containing protein [Kofleriaceae bacterium]|nr:DUF763 domain-containing protein [Kofleriaceae bacterium]